MYKLKYTRSFEKALKKLSKNEQKIVASKLQLLIKNPFYPYFANKEN